MNDVSKDVLKLQESYLSTKIRHIDTPTMEMELKIQEMERMYEELRIPDMIRCHCSHS